MTLGPGSGMEHLCQSLPLLTSPLIITQTDTAVELLPCCDQLCPRLASVCLILVTSLSPHTAVVRSGLPTLTRTRPRPLQDIDWSGGTRHGRVILSSGQPPPIFYSFTPGLE